MHSSTHSHQGFSDEDFAGALRAVAPGLVVVGQQQLDLERAEGLKRD